MKVFILSFFTLLTCILNAQDGQNDATFNPTDEGFGNGANGAIHAMAVQPDGKVVIGGFSKYDENPWKLVRLNPDESVDTSFSYAFTEGTVNAVKLLPDGKFLVAARVPEINPESNCLLFRINADGTLDESYTISSLSFGYVYDFHIRPDGKIWATGWFMGVNNSNIQNIALFDNNGILDVSVAINPNNAVLGLAIQNDGQAIITGAFTQVLGQSKRCIARIKTDFTLDIDFTPTSTMFWAYSVAIADDGKFYVASSSFPIGRYHPDGTTDTTFTNTESPGFAALFVPMVIQPDGKILLGGGRGIQRYNTDGSTDSSFTTINGISGPPDTTEISLLPDGKIFVAGNFQTYEGVTEHYITKRNADGSWDSSFDRGSGNGADNTITKAIPLNNGQILISGYFDHYNETPSRHIAKLLPDGEIDPGFSVGTGFDDEVSFISETSSGKILVAGSFNTYNNIPSKHIVLLNPDGTIDSSFQSGSGFVSSSGGSGSGITALQILSNGKILVSGSFVSYRGTPCHKLICLNPDGSRDMTFNTSFLPAGHFVNNFIDLPEEGKVLVSLIYPNMWIYEHKILYKIGYDGSDDASFQAPTNQYRILSMSLESSGNILIRDQYITEETDYNDRFLRLGANGAIIQVFADSAQTPGLLIGIGKPIPLADGRFFTTATYTSLTGDFFQGLVRHNPDGSNDVTFETDTPITGVYDLFPQQDKLIIAGQFVEVSGIGRNRIARLHSSGILDIKEPELISQKVNVVKKGAEVKVLSPRPNVSQVTIFDLTGRILSRSEKTESGTSEIKLISNPDIAIIKIVLTDGSTITKKMH